MEIKNARIQSTSLTMADHGCLTFWLHLEGDDWGCGFGGYCIGFGYLGADEFRAENGNGLVAMMRIMDVAGVEEWEQLKGKLIRVKTGGWGDGIKEIGNIIEDKWFNIETFFQEKQKENRP